MAVNPNKFISFWQELKRRRVFKVVAMYAGTAFIILQLVDIIAQPLQLPAWTITMVIVFLCFGFIITLLIAWIYDMTPEGIKKTESFDVVRKRKAQVIQAKRKLKASDIIILVMAIVIAILLYPKLFRRDTLERLRASGERISVAVMPFQNMTNDTTWKIWQDGIKDELINYLTNYNEELEVRQTESINNLLQNEGLTDYASITPSVASTISQKLNANVFIFGSIKQAGETLRLNAQLIDSKTEETIKSFQLEGLYKEEDIFHIIDSLSVKVKNFLVISKLEKETAYDIQAIEATNIPEAYRNYIYGCNAFANNDFSSAVKLFSESVSIDSNFTAAILLLSYAYGNQGLHDKAKEWCLKIYKRRDQLPELAKIRVNCLYARWFETPFEEIKYTKELLKFDDSSPFLYTSLGDLYNWVYEYDKAVPEFEKSLKLYKKLSLKPFIVWSYTWPGIAYHKTGQFKKERKLYKKAEYDFPDDYALTYRQAILLLTQGKTNSANEYIKKYISLRKERSTSEVSITSNIAEIYSEAGILDKAEEYFRKALSMQPENPVMLNNLAYFLIDKDRNISEGLQLVEKALASNPDNISFLNCKGWGLYKVGKFNEAFEFLKKSWDLRPEFRDSRSVYFHLQEVNKAMTSQLIN